MANEEAGHHAFQGALRGEVPGVSDDQLIIWLTKVYGGYNLHILIELYITMVHGFSKATKHRWGAHLTLLEVILVDQQERHRKVKRT